MGDLPVATLASGLSRESLQDAVTAAVLRDLSEGATPRGELHDVLHVIVGAVVKRVVSDEPLSVVDATTLRRAWAALDLPPAAQARMVSAAFQAAYRYLDGLAQRTRFARRSDQEAAMREVTTRLLSAQSSVQLALASGTSTDARSKPSRSRGPSLVERVLTGVADDEEALRGGIGEPCGLWIVLSVLPGAHDELRIVGDRAAERAGGRSGDVHPDPIPHVSVLVPSEDALRLRELSTAVAADLADSECKVVALRDPMRRALLPSAYELVRGRLHFAPVLPSPSPVLDAAELDMCAMLADSQESLRSVVFDRVVGPLLAQPELFHVLDARVATGFVKEIPAVTASPRRSLSRYGGDIRRLTGYDWNKPRDRYKLTQATLLRWVAAVSPAKFSERVWGPYPRFAHLWRVR